MKENQMRNNQLKDLDKREPEKDRLMRAMIAAGTFEVECVNCGESVILTSKGLSQSDPEDQREYVNDGIFSIKGGPHQRLYEEAPVLCRGCGLAWSVETLRIKDTN